jgi:hypothetical protein
MILRELLLLLSALSIPTQTGVFSGTAPEAYAVMYPVSEEFTLYGDNLPHGVISCVLLALFSKGSYIDLETELTAALVQSDFCVSDRRYMGCDEETGYHRFDITVEKLYPYVPGG